MMKKGLDEQKLVHVVRATQYVVTVTAEPEHRNLATRYVATVSARQTAMETGPHSNVATNSDCHMVW